MPDLNPRQLRFVKEYLLCGVGAEAARRAGYSDFTAHRAGPKLLRHPKIAAEIDAERAKLRSATSATLEDAIAEINAHIIAAAAARQYTAVATLTKLKYEMTGLYTQRLHMQVETVDLTAALAEARSRAAIDGGRLQVLPPPDGHEVIEKPAPILDIFGD
jgi:phage terminase small subunit